jgi:creatinine amidohydrolase
LLLPVGSVEQHGSHLPLATDGVIATAIVSRVAAVVDVDVAPLFAYSASGEHQGFPGLLSLGTEATAFALTELVRSARSSWSGVVIVSGHGGNAEALAKVADLARHEGDHVAVWLPRAVGADPHAGATETSVAMALGMPIGELPEGEALPATWATRIRTEGVRAVSSSGVLGYPRNATAATGEALLRQWVDEVVALVREIGESL